MFECVRVRVRMRECVRLCRSVRGKKGGVRKEWANNKKTFCTLLISHFLSLVQYSESVNKTKGN